MKNIKIIIVVFLCVSFLFTACRKDQDIVVEEIVLNEEEVLGSITGQVIDEKNIPVENATVYLKDAMQTTDENGFFLFKDKALNSMGTVVKVQSSQHIEVSKIVNPKSNAKTIVNIKLLDKKLSGTIEASSGGIVQVGDGGLEGQINFPEDAFVLKGTATPYTGSVQVFGRIINPANEADVLAIPGDLRGMDISNELVQLASYSMMSVSIETDDGMELELADNKEALISFPVDPTLQANAPATIPLWHYNIETGHWEEEGSAELINNQYEGKVAHFSFWNCDAPFPLIPLSGRLLDENGTPLADFVVSIRITDSGLVRTGTTNASGEFSGGIPVGENLEITFSSNFKCADFKSSQNLGSFSDAVDLGDIMITLPPDLYFITGRLLNCESSATQNGYIFLSSENSNSITYSNSDGLFLIPACFPSSELVAVDYVNGFKSPPIKFESSLEKDTHIGDVFLCIEHDTYINMEYDGMLVNLKGARSRLSGSSLRLFNINEDSLLVHIMNIEINLDLNQEIIGQHENEIFDYFKVNEDRTGVSMGCSQIESSEESCNIKVDITTAQPTGGYIIGTYEGTVINRDTKADIPVSGEFKVESYL